MSSNSFMPVNSPEPTELELSCKESQRNIERGRKENKKITGCQNDLYFLKMMMKWVRVSHKRPGQIGRKRIREERSETSAQKEEQNRDQNCRWGLGQRGCHHHWQTATKRKDSEFCSFINYIKWAVIWKSSKIYHWCIFSELNCFVYFSSIKSQATAIF